MVKSKIQMFAAIKVRVWKKLQGWKEKLLSKAGNEILIKAVAQSIPTYAMSCFRLPKTLCDNLQSLFSKFWWGQTNKERKIHWLGWEQLCKSKCRIGLGFRDLSSFKLALLVKQEWRLFYNHNPLFYKVFKAKYFPRSSFLKARMGRRPSYAWRSIMSAQQLLIPMCEMVSW